MKKLLTVFVAASFVIASVGSFAAAHTGGAPAKDAPKVDCKDPKNKDNAACKGEKDKK